MNFPDFYCYFRSYPFLLFSFFSVFTLFIAVVSSGKLTHVGFRRHVKIASRIVGLQATIRYLAVALTNCQLHMELVVVWSCRAHPVRRTRDNVVTVHCRWLLLQGDQILEGNLARTK